MQPGQPLPGEGMTLGRVRRGIVEGADVEVDLGWPALAFIGER
jgi:hypothetical protein